MKNKKVLISGAGIAGITVAYWLKRYGFQPTLVEKHTALRTGGYKIDIRGVALQIIERMDLYPAIFASRTDMQGATLIDSTGTHSTMSADLSGLREQKDLEIVRGDLCQILLKQAGDVECIFGDSITHVAETEEGVHVEFEQNKPRLFDLVIGADGLHSPVRKLVFGNESNFLHQLGLYISIFTIPNYLHLDRWEIEYYEPTKFVTVFSSRRDPHAKAGFVFPSTSLSGDCRNTEQQKKLLQETFKDVGWEVPRLLTFIEEAPDFYFDSVAQIHMPHWSKGRVVVIGDAAYAPSPLSGQGTSLALVGAYVLAGELARAQGDPRIAFAQYEQLLRTFVEKNQKLAERSVNVLTDSKTSQMTETELHEQKNEGLQRITEAANALTLKNYSNNEKTLSR